MNETEEQRAREGAGLNGGGRKAVEKSARPVLRHDMVRRDLALAVLCGLALAQVLPAWAAAILAFIIWLAL